MNIKLTNLEYAYGLTGEKKEQFLSSLFSKTISTFPQNVMTVDEIIKDSDNEYYLIKQNIQAEAFSDAKTYNIGDYCINTSKLYWAKNDIEAGEFDDNNWQEITISDIALKISNSAGSALLLSSVKGNMIPAITDTLSAKDLIYWKNKQWIVISTGVSDTTAYTELLSLDSIKSKAFDAKSTNWYNSSLRDFLNHQEVGVSGNYFPVININKDQMVSYDAQDITTDNGVVVSDNKGVDYIRIPSEYDYNTIQDGDSKLFLNESGNAANEGTWTLTPLSANEGENKLIIRATNGTFENYPCSSPAGVRIKIKVKNTAITNYYKLPDIR